MFLTYMESEIPGNRREKNYIRHTVETELSEQIRKSFNQVIKVRTKI